MTIAYLNGEFLTLDQAKISPLDRGFLFGDGVYEVIPVYAGKPFRLEQHLQRLLYSLAAISLPIALSLADLENILLQLIQRNAFSEFHQSLYIQCTRGSAPARDLIFPENCQPTIFAYCTPLISHSIEELSKGITAITVPDARWQYCNIKSINLLPNVLARQQAIQSGAQEAILLRDGYALEGSSSNLFIVKQGAIQTPSLNQPILGGITRELVLELIAQQGHECLEAFITESELQNADEIWITSSNREIVPVIKLDNKLINNGQAGPVWYEIIAAYQNFKNNS